MYFQSRDERYRSPFGAVPEGTAIYLRVRLARAGQGSGGRLVTALDGGLDRRADMFWAGMDGDDQEWWDCHYTPAVPGLYWYGFEMTLADGAAYLVRRPDGSADMVRTPGGARWQLTCYEAGFSTPDWLAGGVMYQIFPDRFARSEEPKAGVPTDRVLRGDWGGQPEWRPDATGTIRNNDYFGGDLKGIEQRLDRLAELGVTCLYLNPIFEAHSNHRYDTADYTAVDPLLGTAEDFEALTKTAARLGIRVLLDGVFSHTGADSRYFNKERRYPEEGAFNSLSSPYASWYRFKNWPHEYGGWWGFPTLPEVDEMAPAFFSYINGADGIVRRWLAEGAAGWRLDVADELPDEFLDALRRAAKAEKPDALVLGEVWEDASNKQSYGHRRRYLLGRQLDSVMNYPFRDAVLGFLTGCRATDFFNKILDVVENYPPQVLRLLMNIIGTHDTERALTVLAGEPVNGWGREWQASRSLSAEQRKTGLRRMRLAAALQYCLPGVPCVYYGDEAGVEGYKDPFNRGCYPWGQEDTGLLNWYRKLGQLRKICPALREGRFHPLPAGDEVVAFLRQDGGSSLLCAVNRAGAERTVALPEEWRGRTVNLGGGWIAEDTLHLPSEDCAICIRDTERE